MDPPLILSYLGSSFMKVFSTSVIFRRNYVRDASEPNQTSKMELFRNADNYFHKNLHPRCLTGSEYPSVKSQIFINRSKAILFSAQLNNHFEIFHSMRPGFFTSVTAFGREKIGAQKIEKQFLSKTSSII